MGNSTSRVVGCFALNGKENVNLDFLEPLDEGLGHSFCYVRPVIVDSPAITPSISERYTIDSSTFDSETHSGSFRHELVVEGMNKNFQETTFKSISGASVSANASTARTPTVFLTGDVQEPAASFESTASFAAIPLQPVPRGSGPLNGFKSGPLERGFASGPLERGGSGLMSGPLDKNSFMSGPLDCSDRSNFSAPLHYNRKSGFGKLMRSVSKPMKSAFSRTFMRKAQFSKEAKFQSERNWDEVGPSEPEYSNSRNLQWAHGKAGEDRVHVVLSEEQGWLFVGIYDGFSGPDAPDFLMSNLYKAIDKEMEGLLWDYEDKSHYSPSTSSRVVTENLEAHATTNIDDKLKVADDTIEEKIKLPSKSKRLFELLQMELLEDKQANMRAESVKRESSTHREGDECVSGSEGISEEGFKNSRQKYIVSFSSSKRLLIGSRLRKMYRKQKTLRRKLFPWNYDWHREGQQQQQQQQQLDESMVNSSIVIRRCRSGPVDHNAVLQAMTQALASTEEAYIEMVEKSLDRNPELALMGSCVLVMLMKDQDVYVMNLGDSRVLLAQDRCSDAKDDVKNRNKLRESLARVELDRISEESPIHNLNNQVCNVNKSREISICGIKLRAVQLSTDHSTSIEQEVARIKAEHPDDGQAIMNDRVKGQLKVTRAFGAGFLKKPHFNEALLEIFQVDYIGSSPYLSCIPSILHQRLCPSDRFLVLSSDGLYQYFSNEEVVSHVAWFIENVPEGDPAQYLISELLFRAAKKNGMDFHELLDIPHGDRRKYHDDVSVMVISLEGRIWRSSG